VVQPEQTVAITLYNRQRKLAFSLSRLRRFAVFALRECLGRVYGPGKGRAVLGQLPEVDVSFVSDSTIARMHRRFMGIPGATDVITFDHGELIIGAETAQANAKFYGRSLEQELALYIVHGLLHLNGYLDKEPADAARMHEEQEQVLAVCLAEVAREEADSA
jgi:probable rRNA maturation factor